MRIPIREQLGLLVLFCSLFALMVLAVATWTQNRGFIINIRLSALSLTASLKSAQVSASLLLFQTSVQSIATRIMIQSALQRYNNGEPIIIPWPVSNH
jgi:osomolarity two-component system, sensor histidine kinase SLN1